MTDHILEARRAINAVGPHIPNGVVSAIRHLADAVAERSDDTLQGSGRIIPPPDRGHQCAELQPWRSGGYGSTGLPDGTVWICPCGTAWLAAPCFESLGPTQKWRRVRWYHRTARRQLREVNA